MTLKQGELTVELKANTIVSGVKDIISELERMTKNIFDKFPERSLTYEIVNT